MNAVNKRLALLLGGALVGAGALALLHEEPEAAPQADVAPPAAPDRATPSYEMPPPATGGEERDDCGFDVGARLAYQVDLRTRTAVDAADTLGLPTGDEPRQADQSTSLRLELEVVDANEGAATLLARYGAIESSAIPRPDDLATPFLLRVNRDCSLGGFARHATTHRAHGRVQQSILHELGWRWAEGESEGTNGIGRYLATAGIAEPEGGRLVQRRVLRYDELWNEDAAEVDVERSLLSVRVGAGPWFESLTGIEDRRHGSRRSVGELLAVRMEPSPSALSDLSHSVDDYVWEDLLPADVSIRTPRPITQQDRERQAAVAHLTVDEAMDRYLGRVESGVGIEQTWPELTDYLEARPEQTAPVVHRIQDDEVPAEARSGIYMAIGRARTAEAKQVLIAISADGNAPIIERTRAMFALIDRDDVGVEVARLFDAQAQGRSDDAAAETLKRESLLALGAMAGQQEDAAITSLALAAAESRLGAASSADEMRSAFGAIGNVGDVAALSIVEPYTRVADPEVREVAVHAIRRLHPEASAALVADWLDRERHPLVERRLFQTLVFQCADHQAPPTEAVAERALRSLQRQPESQITRKALIRLLGSFMESAPDEPLAQAAREALVQQVRIELDAGTELYDVLAGFLSANDLHRALGLRELGETDR